METPQIIFGVISSYAAISGAVGVYVFFRWVLNVLDEVLT
jgi:hypothetical protein